MTTAPSTAEHPMAPDALPDFSGVASPSAMGPPPGSALAFLADVEIDVTVELGRRRLSLGEVARLDVGSVVERDALAGEPLVVYANGRRIATGEAVVVDGQFGVRIQEVMGGA